MYNQIESEMMTFTPFVAIMIPRGPTPGSHWDQGVGPPSLPSQPPSYGTRNICPYNRKTCKNENKQSVSFINTNS